MIETKVSLFITICHLPESLLAGHLLGLRAFDWWVFKGRSR